MPGTINFLEKEFKLSIPLRINNSISEEKGNQEIYLSIPLRINIPLLLLPTPWAWIAFNSIED